VDDVRELAGSWGGRVVNDRRPRSSLSFSLRGLLIAAMVMALACIAAGPFVRSLAIEQRWLLLMILATVGAGAIPAAAILFWVRYRVEQRSGQTLVSLTDRSLPSRKYASLFSLLPLCVLLFMTVQYLSIEPGLSQNPRFNRSESRNAILFAAACMGASGVVGVVLFAWSAIANSVELCAHGIAWRAFRFAPWRNVRVLRWDQTAGQLTMSLNKTVVTLNVSHDEWPQVRDVLQEHVEV
jgi:hypothetical protein